MRTNTSAVVLFFAFVLLVAGCASAPPDEDVRACELYEESVVAAEAGEVTPIPCG